MSIHDTVIRTITCNGPECKNTVTFEQKENKEAVDANPWLKSARVIQTGDGRNLVYCSDVCEVNGVGSGAHNPPEAKKVIEMPTGGSLDAIKKAAAAAKAAEEGTKALREGRPVNIQPAS